MMQSASDGSATDGRPDPGPRGVVAALTFVALAALPLRGALAQQGEGDASESSVEVIRHGESSETEEESPESGGESEDPSSEESDEVETIRHAGESTESETGERDDATEQGETGGNESTDESDGAADSSFSAGYATGVWVDTRWEGAGEDVVEWRGSADLQLEQPLSPRWSAVALGEFRYWMGGKENPDETDLLVNATRPRAAARFRLGETYALYQSDRWSFRAGHLKNPWGSTSLIRPGDVVNPVDFTAFAALGVSGDRLLPQPAVELSYVRPNWSLTGLVVPFFSPNRVTLFGRDSAVATARNPLVGRSLPFGEIFGRLFDRSIYEEAQPLLASPSRPDERPDNASLGVRWTGTRWNTDFGLGYFWGWDRTPSLEVDPKVRELARLAVDDGEVLREFDLQDFIARNPEALELFDAIAERRSEGRTLVEIEHERMHSVVANVSRYFGPIGIRADAALHPERTYLTRSLQTVRRPTVFAAAGASWERFVSDQPLVVTVEGFWLEPLAADAGLTEWLVAEGERGSTESELLMFEGGYRGVAGAVDWTVPVADLELRLGSIVEADAGGVVVNGRIARRWEPWLRTSVGAALYEGPSPDETPSLGGLYDRNDRVGVRVDGAF